MLTRFFYRRHREERTRYFLDELEGLFLDPVAFFARLRQERLRSERSNLPLSLVVIDLDRLLDLLAEKTGLSTRRVLRGLGYAMMNMTREYDVKGWYQEREIAVITPDTDEAGAQKYRVGPEPHGDAFGCNVGTATRSSNDQAEHL